jgi:hypothetical protein
VQGSRPVKELFLNAAAEAGDWASHDELMSSLRLDY